MGVVLSDPEAVKLIAEIYRVRCTPRKAPKSAWPALVSSQIIDGAKSLDTWDCSEAILCAYR